LCSGLFVIMGVLINWNIDVMWLMVVLSILRYIFLAGVYYSECIYSIYGRLRAIISIMSYDILLLLVLLVIPNIWLVCIILIFSAEVGRTPSDLVEGESELVSRFNTEYARRVFVGYFLGEYLVLTLFFLVWWGSINIGLLTLSMAILIRRSYPRIKYQELVSIFWRSLFVAVGTMLLV
jgi:NADH-quinone oxidoreductase subunit H